jgi:hypothetical protein
MRDIINDVVKCRSSASETLPGGYSHPERSAKLSVHIPVTARPIDKIADAHWGVITNHGTVLFALLGKAKSEASREQINSANQR